VYLARLVQAQTTALGPFQATFQPSPPPLVAPIPAEAGRTWRIDMNSPEGLTVSIEARVEAANEGLALGDGTAVGATRIARTTRITGLSLQGFVDITEQAQTWVSLEHGIPVKEQATATGKVGLCSVQFNTTAVLRSARPA
jgi:hypothetical protein